MDGPDYICTACFYGFDQDFWDRGLRPICPLCESGNDVLPYEDFRENERINAQEAYDESWRER